MKTNIAKTGSEKTPTVSIIIPVYNKLNYTKKCIESIFNASDDTSYEIIVVNNASTDGTEEYLNSVSNLISINNKENLGFVEACNIGATKSSADYLLFLNNDTEVKDNWISSSIEIMNEDYKCGVVGSKLVFPNGKLQEAGAIILNVAQMHLKKNGIIYITSPSIHWGNNTNVRGVPKEDLMNWLVKSNLSPIEIWEENDRTF